MSDREAMKLALDFVTSRRWGTWRYMENGVYDDAFVLAEALRTALAAPRSEPVAWMRKEWSPDCGSYFDFCAEEEMGWRDRKEWTPLYADPPAAAPSEDIEALRRDAERWRFYEAAGSELTLRLHNTRSDHRNSTIDAAMQEDKR